MTRRSSRGTKKSGGFFLVIVLIIVAVATMAVYSFTELMIAYDESAYVAGDLVQARVNVESAADATRLILSQPRNARIDLGGVYNNPNLFQAVTVSTGSAGVKPSNYSIIAPGLDEYGRLGGIRFGLQDESAKLNLNVLPILEENSGLVTAAAALMGGDFESSDQMAMDEGLATDNLAVSLLMTLPGMTEEIAYAILDWVDEDDEPREFGAELEYYSTLATPYEPTNGPFKSVEELLLVRGITPTLLFGVDSNRNGVVDAAEQQRFGVGVDTPGALGWAAYLTVHGAESNKTDDGVFRVDVNQDDLELLYDELSAALGNDEYASFIVAYRIAGEASGTVSDLIGGGASGAGGGGAPGAGGDQDSPYAGGGGNAPNQEGNPSQEQGNSDDDQEALPWSPDLLDQLDLTAGGGTDITQVLDLIDATVSIGEGDDAQTYDSPFSSDPDAMASYLPPLMDALSTQDVDVLPGRINLNECPAELLYGIPVLDGETVDAILEARQDQSEDPNRRFATWPLVEGLVSLDQMRLLLPLLTGGGDVYRAQIIGYFEEGGIANRSEMIIDATSVNPKVVAMRDLTHLGRGFDLATLGVRTSMAPQN